VRVSLLTFKIFRKKPFSTKMRGRARIEFYVEEAIHFRDGLRCDSIPG
jgi:hypothetical protein